MKFGFKKRLIPKSIRIAMSVSYVVMGLFLLMIASFHVDRYGMNVTNVYVLLLGFIVILAAAVMDNAILIHNIRYKMGDL